MKRFNSIIEAMREVKEVTNKLDHNDEVYLAIDYYGDVYYVSDDAWDIGEAITKDFCENHTDVSPERVAEEWKVIEYCRAERKVNYPYSYESAKKPSFSSEIELIRKYRAVSPEYSVEFNFG